MVELKKLFKKYGKTVVVNDVSLKIEAGEFFCLLGPSGCGKTTILRMIAGFEKPTSGAILLNGNDITYSEPYQRDVNTVFQSYALFPHINIFENIAFGLRLKKISASEIKKRVDEMMEITGLTGFHSRMPAQLSGGQRQRVALARALVNKPSILLLDEPLSALDKKIAEQTRIELLKIQRQVGITFIFVTHNQTEAITIADRIAVMKNGIIHQCSAPKDIYEKPSTYFVADFIGAMNFFDCKISATENNVYKLDINNKNHIILNSTEKFDGAKKMMFAIRPERMRISLLEPKDYENSISGIIENKIYTGEITQYIIRLDSGRKINVTMQNYLLSLSTEVYELNEKVNIIWSKNSGQLLYSDEN